MSTDNKTITEEAVIKSLLNKIEASSGQQGALSLTDRFDNAVTDAENRMDDPAENMALINERKAAMDTVGAAGLHNNGVLPATSIDFIAVAVPIAIPAIMQMPDNQELDLTIDEQSVLQKLVSEFSL